MNKRGQITLFVIIAILLISSVIVIYIYRENLGFIAKANPEIRPIKTNIDNCLERTAEQGAYLLGLQGGFCGQLLQINPDLS